MKKITIFILISMVAMLLFAETPYQTANAAGVMFNYRVTDDGMNLDCQVIAGTTGWVAVGFNPTNAMQDANIIIGYHANDMTMIRDDWGTSPSAHTSDVALGGSDDIISYTSFEEEGNTELHFLIPLDSGDTRDQAMMIGSEYPIILARGQNNADSFTGFHAAAGFATVSIVEPTGINDANIPSPAPLSISSYPNPFNPTTTIKFAVNAQTNADLTIYNVMGQAVKSFGNYPTGNHELLWNGLDNQNQKVSSGIYFAKLRSDTGVITQKLTLIK